MVINILAKERTDFSNLSGLFDLFKLEEILQVFSSVLKKLGSGSPAHGDFLKFFSASRRFEKL